jgi:hypothetical protein
MITMPDIAAMYSIVACTRGTNVVAPVVAFFVVIPEALNGFCHCLFFEGLPVTDKIVLVETIIHLVNAIGII